MSERITLRCANGSTIDICDEDNKDYPAFISWSLGTKCMFGTYENGPELRSFLKKAIRFLERDQRRIDERVTRHKLGITKEQIKRFKAKA